LTIETYLSDLGTYLQGQGYSNIYYMGLDSASNNCISLTPYPGSEYTKIVSGEVNPYSPMLNILVRNSSAQTGLATATAIYKLLRNIYNETIGTTKFINIKPSSTPGFVAKSSAGLYIYSINFSLFIQ